MMEIKLLLEFYNKNQLASELGVTRGMIYRYLDNTHLPGYQVYKEIQRLIEKHGLSTKPNRGKED